MNKDKRVKHGLANNHELYNTWCKMRERCYKKSSSNYERYGARGIRVCDRWLSDFSIFLQDVGERPSADHSLDRIDNLGDYEPDNIKWSTAKEQANNRRIRKDTRWVYYKGVGTTFPVLSKVTGIPITTLKRKVLEKKIPVELVINGAS